MGSLEPDSDDDNVIFTKCNGETEGQSSRPQARGKGRPTLAELIHREGPATLVMFVGTPRGRWERELSSRSGVVARAALQNALGISDDEVVSMGTTPHSHPRVAGFGVIGGWRFLHGPASSTQTYNLMVAARMGHPKRHPPHFLEHNVLASAVLHAVEPVLAPSHSSAVWDSRGHPSHAFTLGSVDNLLNQEVCITSGANTLGASHAPLHKVLAMWSVVLAVDTATFVPWPAWAPLAAALSRGAWSGDVTPLYKREQDGDTLPCIRPPAGQLRAFMASHCPGLQKPAASPSASSALHIVFERPKGAVQSYASEHRLNAIRLGQHQGSQADLGAVSDAALRFHHPTDWKEHKATLSSKMHHIPSPWTLRRGRVKLDCASMLQRRLWYASNGPTYRYLGIDASPQRPGQEVLVCVERVIRSADVHPNSKPPVEERRLPPSTLGHGRYGLAEKVQATIHQTWLDYGPSLAQTRSANMDVRQVLTDMGTEFGIVDYPDVLATCVRFRLVRQPTALLLAMEHKGQPHQHPEALCVAARSFLFPLALCVPGPQHILDGVLREGLHTLPWWPEWQAQAKIVCQWLYRQGHREFLEKRLPANDAATAAHRASLQTGCDRFAEWRWKTLCMVTRSLQRMEDAVRAALGTIRDATVLAAKDSTHAEGFLDGARDAAFWDRARGLSELAEPIHKLSGWIRGCDCHEDGLIAHEAVNCPWKGCRAVAFAARLRAFTRQLQDLPDRHAAGRVPGFTEADVALCGQRMLAIATLKFAWVHEPPYIIWAAHNRKIAQQLLDSHDADIQGGRAPHRVTAHFAGPSSPLRADMEAFVGGADMTAQLYAEVSAYQFCKLDDTWVEASHRDLSGIGKRKGGSKMPFRFATMRLAQNMQQVDNLDRDRQATFHEVLMPKWRGIARAATHRQPKCAAKDAPWLGAKSVSNFVYRQHSESWMNWTEALKHLLPPADTDDTKDRASTMDHRLKTEFLLMVCQTEYGQQMCSLPVVDSVAASRAQAAGDRTAGEAILVEACGEEWRFFQLLMDGQIRRKKQVRGASFHRMTAMACPVMSQEFAVWARGDVTWTVYPDGQPHIIDLIREAEWPVLRAGLRFWRQGPSPLARCVELSGPTLGIDDIPWDIRAGPVPTVVLLERLHAEGWRKAPPLVQHTLDSPKNLRISKNTLAEKHYLQCVLCLPQLLSETYPALPVGQPQDYYAVVLQASRPESIQTGQPAKYYRQLLRGASTVPGAMLLHAEDDSAKEEEDQPMADCLGSVPPDDCAQRAKRKRQQIEPSMQADVRSTLDVAEIEVPSHPIQSEATSAFGHACGGALVSSGSAGHPQREEVAPVRGANPGEQGSIRMPREVVASVAGVDIVQESHLLPGEPGHYRRMAIRCTLVSHRTPSGARPCACNKFRNCGPRQTAHFGDMEPAGYLAAWLRKGDAFETRASHVRYAPTLAEVESEMKLQGWIPSE